MTANERTVKTFSLLFPKSGPLSLQANFVWTLAGNVTLAACQWGMLVVLAKLGSPEMTGKFALGLAVTAPVLLLSNLKLRAVLATDAKEDYQFGHYLALRMLTITVALVIIGGINLIIGYPREVAALITLVGVAKAFDSISDLLYGYLQRRENMTRIAVSRMLQGGLQLLSLAIVMELTGSIVLATLAWALASGAVTIFFDVRSVRMVMESVSGRSAERYTDYKSEADLPILQWDWKTLSQLFLKALPLGLAVMLGSLWINIPRYFIQAYRGSGDLGVFAAVASLMVVGATVVNALGQSAAPRLATYHATQRYKDFDRLLLFLVIIGFSIGLGGLAITFAAGRSIVSLLYTPEYAREPEALKWLMLAYALQFSYVFLGTGIQAMRNFRIHLPTELVNVLIVSALSYVFVGRYGVTGASWAMLGASVFSVLAYALAFWILRRSARMPT